MTKLQAFLNIGVLAILAVPLLVQHKALAKLRVENPSLRRQIDQLENRAREDGRLFEQIAQASLDGVNPADASQELLRVRREIEWLRQQNQGLVKRLPERRETVVTADFEPSSSWSDSGNATPQAAASTFAWAVKTGRTDKLAELLFEADPTTPSTRAAAEQLVPGLQFFMTEIDSSRLVFADDTAPDQVTFWFQSRFKDGHHLVSPLTLRRVVDGWKVALLPGSK